MRALAAALCALVLGACGSNLGDTHRLAGADPARALTLGPELDAFFEVIDAQARRNEMQAGACPVGQPRVICRTYRSRDGVYLKGYLDTTINRYVVTVFEWNVRHRSDKALRIEAEVLAELRKRLGEKAAGHDVVCTMEAKQCPDGSHVGRDPASNCSFRPCPSADQDRRQ
jgi:hypothetical protein